jgi:putative salt-induced outer membrane protein
LIVNNRDVTSVQARSLRSRYALGASVIAFIVSAPSLADAPPPPPDGVWIGQGQGGLVITSGNTDSTSLNAKLDLAETNGPWKNIVFVGGLYGKNNGITSAERIAGSYELDHKISDDLFWFGSAHGVRDLFSGFDYQVTLSAGVGYKFINTADTKFDGLLGIGYERLETQALVKDASGAVVERINGPSQGDLVGTAGLNLEQKLTTSAKLIDKLLVISGSLNTAVTNGLSVQVSMSDALALSVGYAIQYNTTPAAGVKKLDQETTVNVVYNIK